MKKLLLTSTGLENPNIKKKFLELLNNKPNQVKALFIPTAAIDIDAISVLPKCAEDLLNCGILKKNITVYDMHKKITQEEINQYDCVYVCGGKTSYLAKRMTEINWKQTIESYLENGGIYLGVSAGSKVAGIYPNGLELIKNKIDVHCKKGNPNGLVESEKQINLTDNQAILQTDNEIIIFE